MNMIALTVNQRAVQVLDRVFAGLLGNQLFEADQVILAILWRIERVRVRLGQREGRLCRAGSLHEERD